MTSHDGSKPDPRAQSRDAWRSWMIAAQAGDRAAYERLLRSLLPELERFVIARLHDTAGAEDVVQNVLLSLHRARHTYRPERPFEPWVFAIARNAVIDAQRKRGVRMRRELALDDSPEPVADAVAPFDPGDRLSAKLARALERIPATQREAVVLVKLEGLSMAEAAARAGVSAGALKVRAHRGYRALRRRLEEDQT